MGILHAGTSGGEGELVEGGLRTGDGTRQTKAPDDLGVVGRDVDRRRL
jgi:hypothetical protein